MLMWLTLPFYDFCGFRSVAVNSVYKLQFFYIYNTSRRQRNVRMQLTARPDQSRNTLPLQQALTPGR